MLKQFTKAKSPFTAIEVPCLKVKVPFGLLELAVSTYSDTMVCSRPNVLLLAEHHALYQYNLAGAAEHSLGLPQTETACFFCLEALP
jgi:hypothetical protein